LEPSAGNGLTCFWGERSTVPGQGPPLCQVYTYDHCDCVTAEPWERTGLGATLANELDAVPTKRKIEMESCNDAI